MKRLLKFIATISLIWGSTLVSEACGYDGFESSPYAAFKIIDPIKTSYEHDTSSQDDETIRFWHGYTNGEVSKVDIRQFFNIADANELLRSNGSTSYYPLLEWMKTHNKKDAYVYLIYSTLYSKLRQDAVDNWDYEPGNDDNMRSLLANIKPAPTSEIYDRQLFLKARVLHALRENENLIALWKNEASGLPDSALKSRIEGYVGGAYYYAGDYYSALEIFYKLGDRNSLSWCVSKLVGINELKELVKRQSDSPVVLYVLQDYVNYLQNLEMNEYRDKLYREMNASLGLDSNGYSYTPEVYFENASKDFISLCKEVLRTSKGTHEQAWRQAYAFALNLTGDNAGALAQINIAESIPSTPMMESNLRRLSVWLAIPGMIKGDFASEECFVNTFKALLKESQEEKRISEANSDYNNPPSTDNKDFLEGFLLDHGMREFENARRYEDMLVLQMVLDEYGYLDKINRKVPLDGVVEFLEMVKGERKSDMFVKSYVDRFDCVLLSDVIGTRLMRANRFKDALPYLENVPVEWYYKQSTYPYICGRRYQPTYFKRTQYKANPRPLPDGRHYKKEFCNKVIALQTRRENESGSSLAATDYELAGLMFQASPSGDLWAISDYSWSSGDCNELNSMSLYYLKSAWEADNGSLRGKIAYGLMLLPTIRYKSAYGKTWDTNRFYFDDPTGVQLSGYEFIRDNWSTMRNVPEIRTCDVIQAYVAGNFVNNPYNY